MIPKLDPNAIKPSNVEADFKNLIKGVTVLKVGRGGAIREVVLTMTSDRLSITWPSQMMSTKFGQKNQGNLITFTTVSISIS